MFFERPEAVRGALLGRMAVILQVNFKSEFGKKAITDSLDECADLARTAGVHVAEVVTASRVAPHPRSYVGEGKLIELGDRLTDHGADLLLVNHELSAGQQRNLEQCLSCRVMTRTELILSIFAEHARTYEGQLQVELAQLKHAQTRLVRGWTHLDRQKGGINLRGAGETQLELDQRMLGERLKAVQKKLGAVERRRGQGRRQRKRSKTRTVSLVGYTNTGKSTLFNALTKAGVVVEDKLFATLDTTMRRLAIPGVGEVVLADTVGFIRHLPHTLIEAFKATLEEVTGADLLLHVVDASDADVNERIADVKDVLKEIGAESIPTRVVFNKIDALADPQGGCSSGDAVWVSALSGAGLEDLVRAIGIEFGVRAPTEVLLPAEDGRTRAWLYNLGAVIAEQITADGSVALTLRADSYLLERLSRIPRVLLQGIEGHSSISSL
ncbi:MAG: GTPase HflX [Gammaproteobacteria bacterium]|nr:MAG: GTPase HflX [Gammaproteobacteria bacterium]